MVETGGASDDIRRSFEQYQKRYPAEARLRYYREAAAARLQVVQDADATVTLRSILARADEALEALKAADIDHFAQAFERVLRYTVQANIPSLEAAIRRRIASEGGKTSKRPPGPLRAVLEALTTQIGNDDLKSVAEYWERYCDPSEAEFGAAMEYEMYFDGSVYRYHLDGDRKCTRKEISDALSKIRKAKS